MMKSTIFIMLGISALVAGGCIFADGRKLPQSITLSVPSNKYALFIKFNGTLTELKPVSNTTYQFSTPLMKSGTTYWLGFIPHHYIHQANDPFLFVTKDGKEWQQLTPHQIWNLPKDESGNSILNK